MAVGAAAGVVVGVAAGATAGMTAGAAADAVADAVAGAAAGSVGGGGIGLTIIVFWLLGGVKMEISGDDGMGGGDIGGEIDS